MSDLRYFAILLSLVMLMQFNLLLAPAYADVVSVTPSTAVSPGGISGQFAVTKVGALIAADALAILNGTEIKIENHSNNNESSPNTNAGPSGTSGPSGPGEPSGPSGPSGSDEPGGNSGGTAKHNPKYKKHSGDDHSGPLLLGSLIQITTAPHSVNGCAIFTGGQNFNRIDLRACPDRVTTKSGKSYTGKISFASDKALTIVCLDGSHNVDYTDIAEIHSGRAFLFSIPNYDTSSAKMTLTPTCVHAFTHGSTLKKVVIVGIVLTLVAVAIAVPVGVAAAQHHHNNTNNLILANYFQSKQTVPTPVMPTGTTMPTPQQLGATYVSTLLSRPVVPQQTTTGVVTTVRATTASTTTTNPLSTTYRNRYP